MRKNKQRKHGKTSKVATDVLRARCPYVSNLFTEIPATPLTKAVSLVI